MNRKQETVLFKWCFYEYDNTTHLKICTYIRERQKCGNLILYPVRILTSTLLPQKKNKKNVAGILIVANQLWQVKDH